MPPQAGLIAAGIAWNWSRSLVGKKTISMFCREHPVATAAILAGFNAYIWPHLYRKH